MIRKTADALALYIGLHYGEEAAKEFANGKQQASLLPVLEASIIARHAVKVLVYTTHISAKIAALEGQVTAINTAMTASPNDLDLLGRMIDAEDKLEYARQQLLEEPEMVLSMDEKAVRTNTHRSYQDNEQKHVANRGKVYTLILGQCTQVLTDKLKEDSDWVPTSENYNGIRLYELIEKYVLKQTELQYKYLAIQEDFWGVLNFMQLTEMTLNL